MQTCVLNHFKMCNCTYKIPLFKNLLRMQTFRKTKILVSRCECINTKKNSLNGSTAKLELESLLHFSKIKIRSTQHIKNNYSNNYAHSKENCTKNYL